MRTETGILFRLRVVPAFFILPKSRMAEGYIKQKEKENELL